MKDMIGSKLSLVTVGEFDLTCCWKLWTDYLLHGQGKQQAPQAWGCLSSGSLNDSLWNQAEQGPLLTVV